MTRSARCDRLHTAATLARRLFRLAQKSWSFVRRRTVCQALASSALRRSSLSQPASCGSSARPRPAPAATRRRSCSPAAGRPFEASAAASGAGCYPVGNIAGRRSRSFPRTATPARTSSGAVPHYWRAATVAGATTPGGRRSARSARLSGGLRPRSEDAKVVLRIIKCRISDPPRRRPRAPARRGLRRTGCRRRKYRGPSRSSGRRGPCPGP